MFKIAKIGFWNFHISSKFFRAIELWRSWHIMILEDSGNDQLSRWWSNWLVRFQPNMENVFRLTPILLFLMKRSVIIIPVSARFSQRSSAVGRFLLMLLPQKKRMVQNGCFSVQFSWKTCRFSVPGRKKHYWTRLAVTGWNTFHCCYTIFDGC